MSIKPKVDADPMQTPQVDGLVSIPLTSASQAQSPVDRFFSLSSHDRHHRCARNSLRRWRPCTDMDRDLEGVTDGGKQQQQPQKGPDP